jgi:meiotic recombination protein SPO11
MDYRHSLIDPLPSFCLVDNDPHGLNIYSVYKYGGDKLSTIERERLALPELKYLGVRCRDFRDDNGVLPLTEKDKRKIDCMLEKEWVLEEEEILYLFMEWS